MGAEAMGNSLCEVFYIDEERVAAVRSQMAPDFVFARLAETFQALGDPTRVKLIFALSRAELCVCDVAALLGMSVSAISHQLRTLRALRLVRSRREGRRIYYTLDDEHVRTLFQQALDHMGRHSVVSGDGKGEARGGHEEPAAAGAAARR